MDHLVLYVSFSWVSLDAPCHYDGALPHPVRLPLPVASSFLDFGPYRIVRRLGNLCPEQWGLVSSRPWCYEEQSVILCQMAYLAALVWHVRM